MDNGCMCCSVRGDILGAFSSIFAAVDSGNHLDGKSTLTSRSVCGAWLSASLGFPCGSAAAHSPQSHFSCQAC